MWRCLLVELEQRKLLWRVSVSCKSVFFGLLGAAEQPVNPTFDTLSNRYN